MQKPRARRLHRLDDPPHAKLSEVRPRLREPGNQSTLTEGNPVGR